MLPSTQKAAAIVAAGAIALTAACSGRKDKPVPDADNRADHAAAGVSASRDDGKTAKPVEAGGSAVFRSISVGEQNFCGLTSTGAVMCWGVNRSGLLSVDLEEGSEISEPSLVPGLDSGVGFVTTDTGHACALLGGGKLKCWGTNYLGQLGSGKEDGGTGLVQVAGLESGVSDVAVSGTHTCAVVSGGAVKCWGGTHRVRSKCGSDDCDYLPSVPAQIVGLESGAKSVSIGTDFSCALMTSGAVKCWGSNDSGELGDGSKKERQTPEYVSGLESGITAISAGFDHVCALTSAGAVKCWGSGRMGAIGDGAFEHRSVPTQVVGLESGVKAIACGFHHSCAIMDTAV
ncbi:MAG: hypothetical protein FWD57_07085, partial [Polyangiaceae bacterium]|nr:hypothetical protein [Polyangiaceae bacterium]